MAQRVRPVLVAPDKFKGTLSAEEAAALIGRGLAGAGVEPLELLPVSDGGEGAVEAIVRARAGRVATATVSGPLGETVTAAFGLVDDGRTAIVEMAQASGLWRVEPERRDAWSASSRGTGELIAHAIDAGARQIVVTAGGSATTDGGRGALEALGAIFADRSVDLEALAQRLRRVKLLVACDVQNPMCGPNGAARAFAPQKGADAETIARLEGRLERWAALARDATGKDPGPEAMAGAAGGLAGGLWAFAGAKLQPGAPLVLDTLGFDERMRESFAVVTGEGRLDDQTLSGKAVWEVSTRCRQAGVPCYAVVGLDDLDDFGKRMMNIEVVAASRDGQAASAADLERAARILAKRFSERENRSRS